MSRQRGRPRKDGSSIHSDSSTPLQEQKDQMSDLIAEQTARYLKGGGRIWRIEPGVSHDPFVSKYNNRKRQTGAGKVIKIEGNDGEGMRKLKPHDWNDQKGWVEAIGETKK